MGYDPYFIQTEFEVIQSELILGKVITDLDLNKEWGRKYGNSDPLKTTETIALLKGRMDLRPVRNTSLIEILVYSEKPEEAARRSEEHTSELQSPYDLVCRLLLEKKKHIRITR